jgi:hypothetical protein
MPWYAAHILLYARFKDGSQEKYPIWENIVLIEADADDAALAKAAQRGRDAEGDSHGTFTWEGRPATWVFAGIRKLIACADADSRPGDGTEVSYSQMQVATEEALAKLAQGDPVPILYEE